MRVLRGTGVRGRGGGPYHGGVGRGEPEAGNIYTSSELFAIISFVRFVRRVSSTRDRSVVSLRLGNLAEIRAAGIDEAQAITPEEALIHKAVCQTTWENKLNTTQNDTTKTLFKQQLQNAKQHCVSTPRQVCV